MIPWITFKEYDYPKNCGHYIRVLINYEVRKWRGLSCVSFCFDRERLLDEYNYLYRIVSPLINSAQHGHSTIAAFTF